jgi:hypothetical protein
MWMERYQDVSVGTGTCTYSAVHVIRYMHIDSYRLKWSIPFRPGWERAPVDKIQVYCISYVAGRFLLKGWILSTTESCLRRASPLFEKGSGIIQALPNVLARLETYFIANHNTSHCGYDSIDDTASLFCESRKWSEAIGNIVVNIYKPVSKLRWLRWFSDQRTRSHSWELS